MSPVAGCKREIFLRSASFLYLGNGRYGYAAEHYFGKPLSGYTQENAEEAALLATSHPGLCPGSP